MKSLIKKISFMILIPFVMFAQLGLLNPYSLADISGTSTTVTLTNVFTAAKMVKLTAPSANLSSIRYGDSLTSSSRGDILVSGGKDSISAINGGYIDLHGISVYIVTGDKLIVQYWYGN